MAAMLVLIRDKRCFLSSGRDDLQTLNPAPQTLNTKNVEVVLSEACLFLYGVGFGFSNGMLLNPNRTSYREKRTS